MPAATVRRISEVCIFLIVVLVLSSIAAEAQQRQSTYDLLLLAYQSAQQGYEGRAKEYVDRAAQRASSSREWDEVAEAYRLLGYEGAAEQANKMARSR
jgi:hypothetical protein